MNIFGALLMQLLSNPEFQKAILGAFTGIGGAIRQNANQPHKLMEIADTLENRPELMLAAVVKNTEGEHLVDEDVLEHAEDIKSA